MAANEYYGGHAPSNQPYQPYEPYQPFQSYPGSRPSPSSPSSPPPGAGPYDHRQSQQSIASYDHDYAATGGRVHGSTDQYADDIPLKSSTQPTAAGDRPAWMDADTNYPPSPGLPQDEPLNNRTHSRRKRKKKRTNRFFKKKIPWVVYLTSLVAVIVFIVELVKNGTDNPTLNNDNCLY